jgi:hypothetical protein
MTWLGKILTVVVFVGVLVWAYFTIQTYVLRTNWKTELEKYKAEHQKLVAAVEAERNRNRANEDNYRRDLAYERVRNATLTKQVSDLRGSADTAVTAHKTLQDAFDKEDVKATKLLANNTALTSELAQVRVRNYYLEDDRVRLVIDKEDALREMIKARNAEKLARAIAEDNAKKIEDLIVKVSELKASGGTGVAAVARAIEKPPPAILPNLRGQVDDVAGDLIVISIGIDSGVAVGTVLEVYRTENGARFLGTAKVTSAYDLYPKQAVLTFTPARNVPLARLSADELPKKGDLVRPPENR